MVASLQFKDLLRKMDESHDSFVQVTGRDPSVVLSDRFRDNYTSSLQKLRLDVEMRKDREKSKVESKF